jgi:hypothetical protein
MAMERENSNDHFVGEGFNEIVNECWRARVYTAILQHLSHCVSQDILTMNSNSQIRKCWQDMLRKRDGLMFHQDTFLLIGGCC